MKTLFIVRHAKSDWGLNTDDHQRALATRGKNDARRMGEQCAQYLPDNLQIWASTAKRASDTAMIFLTAAGRNLSEIVFRDDLYTFSEASLEKVINTCKDHFDNLMIFGHNEAITGIVNKLGDIFIDNVPTAGFVSITFDIGHWNQIENGKTTRVIFPKELQ